MYVHGNFHLNSVEMSVVLIFICDMQGRLTVVLDLDGTLISSFTPRRAPRLPPGATSYIVGKGGRLNPQGVFVVERPGLQEFFRRVSSFAGDNSAFSGLQLCLHAVIRCCIYCFYSAVSHSLLCVSSWAGMQHPDNQGLDVDHSPTLHRTVKVYSIQSSCEA